MSNILKNSTSGFLFARVKVSSEGKPLGEGGNHNPKQCRVVGPGGSSGPEISFGTSPDAPNSFLLGNFIFRLSEFLIKSTLLKDQKLV